MQLAPVFFTRPDVGPIVLKVAPRLASWMCAEHPDQVKLEKFLSHAEGLLATPLSQLPEPLALRLDVALPSTVDLLDQRDLDNYAFPLASRLSKVKPRALASVWVTKRHGKTSTVGLQQAVRCPAPSIGAPWTQVRTTAAASTTAYKQQIYDQLREAAALPEGPVALELSFTVGPGRNWLNLWKPTIDALGPILGPTQPSHPWHPHDGRIVELGLHHQVDDSLGHDVEIAIAATTAR